MVVALTDLQLHYASYPWMVAIPAASANRLSKDSVAAAFQITSVSLHRCVRPLGILTPDQVEAIATAISCAWRHCE